jgi:hypothetical protein
MEEVVEIQLILLTLFHTFREIQFGRSFTVVYKQTIFPCTVGHTFSWQTWSYPEMSLFIATCFRIDLFYVAVLLCRTWNEFACVSFILLSYSPIIIVLQSAASTPTDWAVAGGLAVPILKTKFHAWNWNAGLPVCVSFKLCFGLLGFF